MATALDDHDAGPGSSPYLTRTCHLICNNNERFAISFGLLEPMSKLKGFFKRSSDARLDFPQEAGHVLVHYLYTGRYQTLRQEDLARETLLKTPLEVSLCVFNIAQTYEVPGLASLAKERIACFSDKLAPLSFLRTAKDISQWLTSSADDTWLYNLVKSRVHRLFEDPKSLDQEGFLELFEPPGAFPKILSRAMMEELCCLKTSMYTPSTASAEAAPHIPELREPLDVPDGLCLEPESPEPIDQPERLLKQLVELEPEAKPTEDVETFEVQTEVTRRASWSSLQGQPQNGFQDEGSPAPRLSKKDLKKKKKKKKLLLAGDCPDHMPELSGEGDA